MIIYHPKADPYHCLYRCLSILTRFQEIKTSTLFIVDYYYLFPSELKRISGWPRKNSTDYKLLQIIPDPIERIDNPQRVFYELGRIQKVAIRQLLTKNIVKQSADEKSLSINEGHIPDELVNLITNDPYHNTDSFRILCELATLGQMNNMLLRQRTGLMEHRYGSN